MVLQGDVALELAAQVCQSDEQVASSLTFPEPLEDALGRVALLPG